MSTPDQIPCPTCQVSIKWSDKFPYRPFCSLRCQQMDFGDWADERYRVAGESAVAENFLDDEEQH